MKPWFAACALIALSACASQGTKVSCDGRLQPINPPASVLKDVPKSDATAAVPAKSSSARPAS